MGSAPQVEEEGGVLYADGLEVHNNHLLLHAAVHCGPQGTGGPADWLLGYVPQGVNADWLLGYVPQGVNSDWLLGYVPQGVSSDWLLGF